MTKLTPEQLEDLYQKLPQDLKDAYWDAGLDKLIQSIGKKHKLKIDKMGELADETGLVMLGFVHPKNFIGNLARRLEVDGQTAKNIAEDVNKQIFQGVRESLKTIHGLGSSSDKQANLEAKLPSDDSGVQKKDILKEIEKEEDEVPEIFKGTAKPPEQLAPNEVEESKDAKETVLPTNPFEAKMKEGGFRAPAEEKKYPKGDPYREPVG